MDELTLWMETYEPMIKSAKRLLSNKWFALEPDEIGGIINLSIMKLFKKNKHDVFVLTKSVLLQVGERAIIKRIMKEPGTITEVDKETHKKRVTPNTPASLDELDTNGLPRLDSIGVYIDPMQDEDERLDLEDKKNQVLTIITQRCYDQLIFEYENKCVTPQNLNLIQKIKRELGLTPAKENKK
jgi:hypothetical protein